MPLGSAGVRFDVRTGTLAPAVVEIPEKSARHPNKFKFNGLCPKTFGTPFDIALAGPGRRQAATEPHWRRMSPLLQWRQLLCRRSLLLRRAATCTGRSPLPPRPRLTRWPRRPRRRAGHHRASSGACAGTRKARSGTLKSPNLASKCTFPRATIFSLLRQIPR